MKNQIIKAVAAVVLSAGIFAAPAQNVPWGISISAQAKSAEVAAPSASKKSGTYYSTGTLKLKLTAQSGAKIYYSTGDGFKQYTKTLKLTKNTSVKCYAVLDGEKSETVTYKYKLTARVDFSEDEGSYDEAVTVKLSSTASGVKLYYTLDGTKPTTSSSVYSSANGIKISESSMLRVMAYKSGWSKRYFTKEYEINESETTLVGESILDDYENKYAYGTLTSKQKKIYSMLFEAAEEHKGTIDISSLNAVASDVTRSYWAFDYDNPQFFWLGNGCSYSYYRSRIYSITLEYSRTEAQAEAIQPEFDAAANEIIEEALEQNNLFDRVKVIHDAIADMTEYSKTGISAKSEADGPLVYGVALCEGYSKAFMYLCQSVGIECICVAGYANEPHMWNMLKLDGEWYNMDVTWDDTGDGIYDYFCVSSSAISADHTFDNFFPIPSAVSDKYSYNTVMGITTHTNYQSAYNSLVDDALANWKKGVKVTSVVVSSSSVMNRLVSKMTDSLSYDLAAGGCNAASWSASYSDKTLTLTLS